MIELIWHLSKIFVREDVPDRRLRTVLWFFQVALCMLREEGFASFYKGLGPSLIAIAPYIAVNFCVFDL